jgi:hypothetical protein
MRAGRFLLQPSFVCVLLKGRGSSWIRWHTPDLSAKAITRQVTDAVLHHSAENT